MLYMINKSPLLYGNLASALRFASKGSPILLYEDGVYAAAGGAQSEAMIQAALQDHAVYVLEADLQARGLTRLSAGVQIVGYDGFVALVEQHNVAPWI